MQAETGSVYHQMFHTVAAGLVADELPKDLIAKFLEAIEENMAAVYHGLQPISPQKPAQIVSEEANSLPLPSQNLDKKRSQPEELEQLEEKTIIDNPVLKAKKSLPVKAPPKGT